MSGLISIDSERVPEHTHIADEASGGSHDWAKGQLKVPYAYLIELRPKNTMMGHGFLLPEREIVPTGLETFESIKVVADELVAQFVEPVIRAKITTTAKPCMIRNIF